jgi:hypothetical protein
MGRAPNYIYIFDKYYWEVVPFIKFIPATLSNIFGNADCLSAQCRLINAATWLTICRISILLSLTIYISKHYISTVSIFQLQVLSMCTCFNFHFSTILRGAARCAIQTCLYALPGDPFILPRQLFSD